MISSPHNDILHNLILSYPHIVHRARTHAHTIQHTHTLVNTKKQAHIQQVYCTALGHPLPRIMFYMTLARPQRLVSHLSSTFSTRAWNVFYTFSDSSKKMENNRHPKPERRHSPHTSI